MTVAVRLAVVPTGETMSAVEVVYWIATWSPGPEAVLVLPARSIAAPGSTPRAMSPGCVKPPTSTVYVDPDPLTAPTVAPVLPPTIRSSGLRPDTGESKVTVNCAIVPGATMAIGGWLAARVTATVGAMVSMVRESDP